MSTYTQYRRTAVTEMADWSEGFDMAGVSISEPDKAAGSPKAGDKIARNPKNHADRWLVAAAYFADNFEAAQPSAPLSAQPVARFLLVAMDDDNCGNPTFCADEKAVRKRGTARRRAGSQLWRVRRDGGAMTNEQIIAYQREQARLRKLSVDLPPLLGEAAHACNPVCQSLLRDAHDLIRWYEARVKQLNGDLRDEQRESQRSAGDAYSDGRHDGIQESRGY